MAESLIGGALKSLLPLVGREFATFAGIRQKAEKLSNTLNLTKAYLDDAEEKQMTSRYVKAWLQDLKDAVYVLEDVLDDCSVSNESLQLGGLCSFTPDKIIFRWRVGRRLNQMIARLDQIFEAKNKLGDRITLSNHVRERPAEVAEWRETSPSIASPQVYGRDDDKKRIIDFLLGPARDSDSVSVYPIVGLGGLGKTTLAQLVYNDQSVSDHFDLKIWICVSENFNVKSILHSIIESIKEEKCENLSSAVMEQKVKELLQSKRYLLVLDDVWKRSQQLEFGFDDDKWDRLRSVLSCASKGASILITTRDMEVATIMGAYQLHPLNKLSDIDCWLLFKQRAFVLDKEEPEELVAIGKEIVKKCQGSPLAAKVLGGLMRSRSGGKQWRDVQNSKLWSTLPKENHIFHVLKLSYIYLTPTSKQCFAFCAIFPKDAVICKQELIYLWMANGFISSEDNLEVEEVGDRIWNDLYQKSFFQDVQTYDYLGNTCFKMHDLIHDLAQSITEQECICFEETYKAGLSRNTHHIGFGYDSQTLFKNGALDNIESLRTLYHLQSYRRFYFCIPTNSSLRVLRLSFSKLSSLEKLIHLRYLEFHDMKIKTLPNSIYNLRQLEVLKLTLMIELGCLPEYMACLQKLRHLVINGCLSLSCMFPYIHKMSSLRTLTLYIVKKNKGHSLAELCNLKLLRGQLTIEGLENVGTLTEAQEAMLRDKEDLQGLTLSWAEGRETKSRAVDDGQVLEALQPHSNLKVLTINYYKGLHLPSWMGNNSSVLNKLVSLQLYECQSCEKLPWLGKLHSLKKLDIYRMDNVQYLDDDECYDGVDVRAFPSLEELRLDGLPKLKSLMKVERGDIFPCLSTLEVIDCRELVLPALLPCVKYLTVRRGDKELLRSICNFSTLESLVLEQGRGVASFPEGMMNNMTRLKFLQIWSFEELKELPDEITRLSALEYLEIRNCNEIESLPEHGWECLCSLATLRIENCEGLRSLPEGVRHLTSLRYLDINRCHALKSLPEGVRYLNPVESLRNSLMERYWKGKGRDWHKISHIPNVKVGL